MKARLRKLLTEAKALQEAAERKATETESPAFRLAAKSVASHVDDLTQQLVALEDRPAVELVEMHIGTKGLRAGSITLQLLAKVGEDLRQTLGHAAVRLREGGADFRRVPQAVFAELDLRLAGVLPGSTRLLILAAANRDLFDDGLSKGSLERVFQVLDSKGEGSSFLEAVNDLGPFATRRLRALLRALGSEGANVALSWRYSGKDVRSWEAGTKAMEAILAALEVTETSAPAEVILEGVIDLLSKRERVYLLDSEGRQRVLFPKRLLPAVSQLHLDQRVRLRCSVTETQNPLTNETRAFYELIEVLE